MQTAPLRASGLLSQPVCVQGCVLYVCCICILCMFYTCCVCYMYDVCMYVNACCVLYAMQVVHVACVVCIMFVCGYVLFMYVVHLDVFYESMSCMRCMCGRCVDVLCGCGYAVCVCCLYPDQVGTQAVWRDIWTIHYSPLTLPPRPLVLGQDNVLKTSFLSAAIMLMKALQREDGTQNYKFTQISELISCLLVSDPRALPSRCSQGPRGARRFHRHAGSFSALPVRPPEGAQLPGHPLPAEDHIGHHGTEVTPP